MPTKPYKLNLIPAHGQQSRQSAWAHQLLPGAALTHWQDLHTCSFSAERSTHLTGEPSFPAQCILLAGAPWLTHSRCMHIWPADSEFPDILRARQLTGYWHTHSREKPALCGKCQRTNPGWWLHPCSWTQSTSLLTGLDMGGGGLWNTSSACQYYIPKSAINPATKLSREYCYLSFVLPPLLSFCLGFGGFGNTFIHSKEKSGLLLT